MVSYSFRLTPRNGCCYKLVIVQFATHLNDIGYCDGDEFILWLCFIVCVVALFMGKGLLFDTELSNSVMILWLVNLFCNRQYIRMLYIFKKFVW